MNYLDYQTYSYYYSIVDIYGEDLLAAFTSACTDNGKYYEVNTSAWSAFIALGTSYDPDFDWEDTFIFTTMNPITSGTGAH